MQAQLTQRLVEFLAGRHVLVIEPSANFRSSIKQFFTNMRIEKVRIVSTIAEARVELLTKKIGLFIVEWDTKDMNGLQLCRELRQEARHKDTPYILMSSDNQRCDVILASEVGIQAYLLKPFSYEEFCNQVYNIAKNSAEPDALNQLLDKAEQAFRAGNLAESENLLNEAKKQRPSSARALTGFARLEMAKRQPDIALRYLQEAISFNADYLPAHRALLTIYDQKRDLPQLIRAATAIHAMSPENPKYTLVLAKAYLETKDLEASEEFYRKTIRLSPKLAEAHRGLGDVFMLKKEYERAMKQFTKALDLDKDDISTMNSLGLAFVRLGLLEKGIERYRIALALNPHDERIHFNLGYAFEKSENTGKAIEHYRLALHHNGRFVKAKRRLERLLNSERESA